MARIRTIKPAFFKNEKLAELSAMNRLLFIGLWTQADRLGRLEDRPKRIKAELFPYDNIDVDKSLNELQNAGFILRYKANVKVLVPEQTETEVAFIQVLTFSVHQVINVKEQDSTIPAPCKSGASITGREGKGTGKEQERNYLIKIGNEKFFKKGSEILSDEYRSVLENHLMGALKGIDEQKVLDQFDIEYPQYDFKDRNHLSNSVKGLKEKIQKNSAKKENGKLTNFEHLQSAYNDIPD